MELETPQGRGWHGRFTHKPKSMTLGARQRANGNYYWRNREHLKAKSLARWRRINGKV